MKNTKITVCVPTYNRYEDLDNLIKSFLTLEYKNAQFLVLDDLGSPKISEVVKKWQKKSKKILYHKNKKNLGFSDNFLQSFDLINTELVVFMGDDDLFIDTKALSYVAKAFENKEVAVVKAAQILYKNGKVNQAHPIENKNEEMTTYSPGIEAYRHPWFDSLSITGLAFRMVPEIKKFRPKLATLYPQVDLMGKLIASYKSTSINKYLVAVQSHDRQLNPIIFSLDGKPTTILNDWLDMHHDVVKTVKKNSSEMMTDSEFRHKLTKFVTVFFPYTVLNNGRMALLKITKLSIMFDSSILFFPFFWISFLCSMLLPNSFLKILIEKVKRRNLHKELTKKQITTINKLLSTYY